MADVCLRHRSPCISEYAEEKGKEQITCIRNGKSEADHWSLINHDPSRTYQRRITAVSPQSSLITLRTVPSSHRSSLARLKPPASVWLRDASDANTTVGWAVAVLGFSFFLGRHWGGDTFIWEDTTNTFVLNYRVRNRLYKHINTSKFIS